MNDLTIKNATEEQCKVLIQQANDRLAELAKPKQYVFKEGDFRTGDEGDSYSFSVIKGAFSKYSDWLQSFKFLSYHCLKLGGRVMSKPNDNELWYVPVFDFKSKAFKTDYFQTTNYGVFHFRNDYEIREFLSTEGVQDHIYNFFQIER